MAKIAWIDDEQEILDDALLNFQMEGLELDCFNNPGTVLSMIDRGEFSYPVVITDMRMPRVSGRQIVEALHLQKTLTRVFVASGHISDREKAELRSLFGVNGFFDKPFMLDRIIETVSGEV